MERVKRVLHSVVVDCSCSRWSCWHMWRCWFKPLMTGVYLMILLVALPLLIWHLQNTTGDAHFRAWFIAGIFVLLTLPIFLFGLTLHLLNYTKPHLQTYIVRILWIVPVYSIDSWLSLLSPKQAIIWSSLRNCYESYALYCFTRYLLNFLESNYDIDEELEMRPIVKQPIVCFCCPPWPKGRRFIKRSMLCVLQYVIVNLVLTAVTVITELCGVFEEGNFRPQYAFLYVTVLEGVSQFVAIHGLIYFYKGTISLLKPLKPIGKFASIKLIIFFMFWQQLLITILVATHVIKESERWKDYDIHDIGRGLQNLIVCIEMLFFAAAHLFVFSHVPYVDPAANTIPCVTSCFRTLDVRDVYSDVKEHLVDPIPRPQFPTVFKRYKSNSDSGTSLSGLDREPQGCVINSGEDGISVRGDINGQTEGEVALVTNDDRDIPVISGVGGTGSKSAALVGIEEVEVLTETTPLIVVTATRTDQQQHLDESFGAVNYDDLKLKQL